MTSRFEGAMFLDFDGPISTRRAYLSNQDTARSFLWSPTEDSIDNGMRWLDETSCRLINSLCVEFNLEVIISSTWRKLYRLSDLQEMLYIKGGIEQKRVTGVTPVHPRGIRGLEIQKVLDDRPDISVYLIVDDDMGDIKDWHPKINIQHVACFDNGLSYKEFMNARAKLAQQKKNLTANQEPVNL